MFCLPYLIPFVVGVGQTPSDLVPLEQARIQEYKKVQDIWEHLADSDPYAAMVPATLIADPDIRAMGLGGTDGQKQLEYALGYRFDKGLLTGYKPLDFSGSDAVLNRTIARVDGKGNPIFVTLKDGFKDVKLGVYEVKATQIPAASPNISVNAPPQSVQVYIGILNKDDLVNTLAYDASHPQPGQTGTLQTQVLDPSFIPVELYENAHGRLLAVLDKEPPQPLVFPERPEFGVYDDTPDQAAQALKDKKMGTVKGQTLDWAVKEPDGIMDIEHIRRNAFLSLQKLRDQVKEAHPADVSDFPTEMLQTPEFKATGLRLQAQSDQTLLYEALTYKPEGSVFLKGYHPIDYATDKAASESVITTTDGSKLAIDTLKNVFQGKECYIYKLKLQAAGASADTATETYYGPATQQQIDAIKKVSKNATITQMKDQAVPLTIYTDQDGDVAFVLESRPKDLLLIKEQPTLYVVKDAVPDLAPLEAGGDAARKAFQALHRVAVDYAFPSH